MDRANRLFYNNPTDPKTNLQYFVPFVAKNKDFLNGYIRGTHSAVSGFVDEFELKDVSYSMALDSNRFNDIMPDGRRMGRLTQKEMEDYLKESEVSNEEFNKCEENKVEQKPHYFHVTCPHCDTYHSFNDPEELPEESFKCTLCDKVLIDYTHLEDFYFTPEN